MNNLKTITQTLSFLCFAFSSYAFNGPIFGAVADKGGGVEDPCLTVENGHIIVGATVTLCNIDFENGLPILPCDLGIAIEIDRNDPAYFNPLSSAQFVQATDLFGNIIEDCYNTSIEFKIDVSDYIDCPEGDEVELDALFDFYCLIEGEPKQAECNGTEGGDECFEAWTPSFLLSCDCEADSSIQHYTGGVKSSEGLLEANFANGLSEEPTIDEILSHNNTHIIQIFNLQGNLVTTIYNDASLNSTNRLGLKTGIYIFRTQGSEGIITGKFFQQ